MSDIFREVDEALSREKASQLWKNYGPTLLMAAVVIVVSTAATTAYRTWDAWRDQQETSKIITAMESKDVSAALEAAAADTRSSHKALALMNAAAKSSVEKDFVKAATLYESVTSDSSAPDDLRDVAAIYGVRAQMLMKDAAPDYNKLLEILLPVAQNSKSPFQLQAKLDAALLYGDGLKDYTKAIDLLKGLSESSAPDSLKEKATALQQVYAYELSQAKSSAPTQTP